jgi:hypothetical protein
MAILHCEGFDSFSGVSGPGSLASAYASANADQISTDTRFSVGQCLVAPTLQKAMPAGIAGYSQMTVGWAAQLNGAGGYPYHTASTCMLQLYDAGNNPLFAVVYDGIDNRVYFNDCDGSYWSYTNSPNSNGSQTIDFWSPPNTNAWYYFEVVWKKGTTTSNGTLQVYINGTQVLNRSDVNVGTTNAVTWGCASYIGICPWKFDDLYISDGIVPLGDSRIITEYPSADTAQKNFTPLSGSSNYAMINEVSADGDASTVSSSTVGASDLYNITPYTFDSSTIRAVKTFLLVRKDISGNRVVESQLYSGGTLVAGTPVGISQSYEFLSDIFTNDPATGAGWSATAVSNLEIGFKIVS